MPLVANGTVDIECGSTTNLVERQKQVAFSPDIFRYNVRMLVQADSGIKSIADLQGKTVVTTTGTTSFRLLREADKGKNLEVTNSPARTTPIPSCWSRAAAPRPSCSTTSCWPARSRTRRNPKDFVITGESLRTENQSLMFRKDDPEFKALVDRVVGGMMKSGEMEKLYNKWFMSPIPPEEHQHQLPAECRDEGGFCQSVVEGHLNFIHDAHRPDPCAGHSVAPINAAFARDWPEARS